MISAPPGRPLAGAVSGVRSAENTVSGEKRRTSAETSARTERIGFTAFPLRGIVNTRAHDVLERATDRQVPVDGVDEQDVAQVLARDRRHGVVVEAKEAARRRRDRAVDRGQVRLGRLVSGVEDGSSVAGEV